jgi:hypothetical protein
MLANRVFGMWQSMHRLPGEPVLWCECASTFATLSWWQGKQAPLGFSEANLYRPLEVWQWMQSNLPERRQGLMSQLVYV